MSGADVHERAGVLRRDRVPFVHARVVRAEKPTSARPGDEALVLADGTVEGFVGGACAEATVRTQSLALLDSGDPLLLRITPADGAVAAVRPPDPPGTVTARNPCLSGGTLEIFLEPVVPAPLVAVAGETPVARALLALGAHLGYHVVGYDPAVLGEAAAVVVASHGRHEEEILAAALAAAVPYVGLVASAKRGPAVLAAVDVDDDTRARVSTPAGLDIGARTPEEIALSILAEIVARRSTAQDRSPVPDIRASVTDPAGAGGVTDGAGAGAGAGVPAAAPDPVCGMTVAVTDTSLHLDADGRRFWFCGRGCLRAFAGDPSAYGAGA